MSKGIVLKLTFLITLSEAISFFLISTFSTEYGLEKPCQLVYSI